MIYKFKDLIDIPKLQELTDELYASTSIPSAIIDMDGEILTGSGWQKICTDFHRKHPESKKECDKSDSMIRKQLAEGEPYVIYKCPRGLVDASSPIIVGGEHVANVFSGQVFLAPPDHSVQSFFREQAKRFDFNEEDYMSAFKEIPVFTEEKFRSGISFLSKLSNIVANMGITRLNELKSISALKKSEAKYRSLFENMAQGSFYQRDDGVLTEYNNAALEMFGLTADQFIGKTSLDPQWKVIHEDDTDFPGENHPSMTALKTGEPVRNKIAGVYNVKKKDFVWLSINATPEFREGEDKPYQAFVTMHDITDLKYAKEALQKSEMQYRLLFKNMMNGFALHEIVTNEKLEPIDYIFLDVNPTFEEFTSLKKKDIIGKKVTEVLPGTENDPANWIGRYGDVALTGRAIRFEQFSEAINKWFSVLAFSPQQGQFATVFQDISKRKQSEAELKKTKKLLERTQAITKLGGWEYDVVTRELIWTDEVFRIHGIKTIKNPVDLDTAISFYGPVNARLIEQTFQRAIEKAEPYDIETELIRADNKKIWVRTMGKPIFKSGNVIKITGNILDITDRKQAEIEKEKLQTKLLQAQKMESIGTLAGGIAHDFNNILSIIIGNTELALEDVPNWNPAFKNIQEIKTAGFRARDVVKQLLSFSRKTKEEQKPIDIVPIVKESLKLIKSTIPASIEINETIPESTDTILADATQIHQVIINLCANAAHAMVDEQGAVEVSIETIDINDQSIDKFKKFTPGKYVALAVKDNGTGIDRKSIEKIFDPYFTTKAVGKGTGMGLAVVHGIVKNHNAQILVDSTPEKGTMFTIIFPVVTDLPKQKLDESHTEVKRSGKGTILFVDDETSIVEMAERILTKLGYRVEISTNPIHALTLFKEESNRYDLVISDMTMPQMNGVKFSEQIRKFRPDIPIIICTGHSSLIDEEKAKNMGISAFVMKPVTMAEISKLIRDVLEK